MKSGDRALHGSTLVAVLVGMCAIWLPAMVPGTDTPTHIAFAMLLANPEAAGGLITTSWAPTSQLFVWLAVPFVALGPAIAAKAAVSATFVLYVAGAAILGRTLTGRASLAASFGAASFFGFSFAMGFFNFTLAAGLGMAMIASSVRVAEQPRLGRVVMLALVAGLTLHAHVIVFGMFALQSVVTAASFIDRPRWLRTAGALAAALAPSSIASLVLVAGAAGGLRSAGIADGIGNQRLPFDLQLANLAYTSFGGLSAFGAVAAAALVIAAIAGAWPRRVVLLLVSSLVWLTIYFAVPFHVAGWAFAQPRALLPLVAVLLGLAAMPTRGRAAGPVFGAIAVIHIATAIPALVRDGRATADEVLALGDLPTGRALIVRLGAGIDPARRYVAPLHHVAQYAVGRGGVDPDWEAMNPTIHSVRAAVVPQPPHLPHFLYVARDCSLNPACANFAQMAADRAFVVAAPFDSVLVTGGSPAEREAFVARGFRPVADERFLPPQARALDVTLFVDSAHENANLSIRLTFGDTIGPFAGVAIPAGPARSIEHVPVGPVPEGTCLVEVTTESGQVLSRTPIEVSADAPLTLPLTLHTDSP